MVSAVMVVPPWATVARQEYDARLMASEMEGYTEVAAPQEVGK
jgi:hypothetical protein